MNYRAVAVSLIAGIFSISPVMADTPIPANLKVSGYVDGSYNIHDRNYFTSGAFDREFDLVPNGVTLQQAALTFAYQPTQGFGGVFNPIMGRDANVMASYGFTPASEFDSQTIAVAFPQVYLQYVKGSFTVMAGTFLSLIGYEAIDPTQDVNFSRSVCSYNTPNTNTGIRGIYALNDKISITAGINNGWDNIRNWGRRKTVEFSFAYTVNPLFSFSINAINGQERATPRTDFGPLGICTLIDFIATYNVTDKLTLVAITIMVGKPKPLYQRVLMAAPNGKVLRVMSIINLLTSGRLPCAVKFLKIVMALRLVSDKTGAPRLSPWATHLLKMQKFMLK